jgi:hypothetical protein
MIAIFQLRPEILQTFDPAANPLRLSVADELTESCLHRAFSKCW